MQSISWYLRRLQAMSGKEIAWRTKSFCRDAIDRYLVNMRQRVRPPLSFQNSRNGEEDRSVRLCDMELGEWASLSLEQEEYSWRQRLLVKADQIASYRLSFLGLKDQYLGKEINWNYEYKTGKNSPMKFSPAIDYRNLNVTGDCKFLWEPNRHHHLVVLGRAYRASGDVRYARAAVKQLESWLQQNPFGIGMNWRSPLELGLRLINWVWTIDLIYDSGLIEGVFKNRLLDVIDRHIWEIDRKYSVGSSANNHLIGEAAGVFIASSYFPSLKNAARWQVRSRKILLEQIICQTHPDGGTREQAIGYHLFALQFFLISGLMARKVGQDFTDEYWSHLEKMFEFIGVLSEGGTELPMFGDADEGYVLDLGGDPRNVRVWLSIGAILYGRSDFKRWAQAYAELCRWLLGRSSRDQFDAIGIPVGDDHLSSRDFPDTGCYLLQSSNRDENCHISVIFDCGEHGFKSIAAHAHADALSFVLRAFGRDVLVDPGTYDYFSYPKWREYFRSTRAHNTVVIDGRDQSEMLGLFLWGRRAKARCLSWQPSEVGGRVIGEHDGYTYLKDPVTHRRSLDLDGRARRLIVRDDIIACAKHEIEISFHLAEHCVVNPAGGNCYLVDVGLGTITIELDPHLKVEEFKGSEDPICGWISRGYHRKEASTTLVGRCVCKGNTSLVCRIDIGELKQVFK